MKKFEDGRSVNQFGFICSQWCCVQKLKIINFETSKMKINDFGLRCTQPVIINSLIPTFKKYYARFRNTLNPLLFCLWSRNRVIKITAIRVPFSVMFVRRNKRGKFIFIFYKYKDEEFYPFGEISISLWFLQTYRNLYSFEGSVCFCYFTHINAPVNLFFLQINIILFMVCFFHKHDLLFYFSSFSFWRCAFHFYFSFRSRVKNFSFKFQRFISIAYFWYLFFSFFQRLFFIRNFIPLFFCVFRIRRWLKFFFKAKIRWYVFHANKSRYVDSVLSSYVFRPNTCRSADLMEFFHRINSFNWSFSTKVRKKLIFKYLYLKLPRYKTC